MGACGPTTSCPGIHLALGPCIRGGDNLSGWQPVLHWHRHKTSGRYGPSQTKIVWNVGMERHKWLSLLVILSSQACVQTNCHIHKLITVKIPHLQELKQTDSPLHSCTSCQEALPTAIELLHSCSLHERVWNSGRAYDNSWKLDKIQSILSAWCSNNVRSKSNVFGNINQWILFSGGHSKLTELLTAVVSAHMPPFVISETCTQFSWYNTHIFQFAVSYGLAGCADINSLSFIFLTLYACMYDGGGNAWHGNISKCELTVHLSQLG